MKTNKQIKCLIWDLDNTVWSGTIAEQDSCRLKKGIKSILRELDSRGILMSIASNNDTRQAEDLLRNYQIFDYFIHPQINWENKVRNIQKIVEHLNIALNTIAFIDDEPFELAQVQMLLPAVRTYSAKDYDRIQSFSEFNPQFVTDESSRRRDMYFQIEQRNEAEKKSRHNRSQFLRWTQTRMLFRRARFDDFDRIMELMNRTSQLNATGKIYSPELVQRFLTDRSFHVYIAQLEDRFVNYGKIGVAICQMYENKWRLISFLLSCRVLSRGISSVFLNMVRNQAYRDGVRIFEACYRKMERNRKMLMLYNLNGLVYRGNDEDDVSIYSGKCKKKFSAPKWLTIIEEQRNEKVSSTVD